MIELSNHRTHQFVVIGAVPISSLWTKFYSACNLPVVLSVGCLQVVDIIHPGQGNVSKSELGEMIAKVTIS